MKTLYQINQYQYPTGKTQSVDDRAPVPPDWVDQEPPSFDSYRWTGLSWQEAPTRQDWFNRPSILGAAKQKKRSEATEQFQATLERGFTDSNGITWQATQAARDIVLDLTQRIQEYRAGTMSSPLPKGKAKARLRDAAGQPQEATPDEILAIAELGSDLKEDAQDRLEELVGQIMAATSHADLNAIDVTTGWPG